MAYKLLVKCNPTDCGAPFFSINGGSSWSSSIALTFTTSTTITLQVKSSAISSETTYYFWEWQDGYKGFDRKVTVDSTITLTANVSTSPKPVNKIVLGGSDQTEKQRVLLDLSSDTVDADHLAQTYIAHNNKGEVIEGNLENVDGNTLYWQDAWDPSLPLGGPIYVPSDGAFTVDLNSTNHTAENIKNGVQLLGKTGTYTSDATLNNDNLLPDGVVGYGNATKYTGTATTHSSTATTPITDISLKTIVQGPSYISNGVSLNAQVSDANLTTSNIKGGVTILGVPGDPLVADVGDSDIVNSSYILKGKIYYGLDDDATSATKVTGTLEFPTEYPESGSFVGNTATSYIIDPSTTALMSYAFYNKNTTTIQNLDQIASIGQSCFEGCKLSGEITMNNLINITGISAFLGCTNITKFSSDTLLRFGTTTATYTNTFYGCTLLEEVNLPNFIGTVATNSFYNCTSLKQLNMPQASYFSTQSLRGVANNIQINVSDACDWYFNSTSGIYDMPVYGDGTTSLWCNLTNASSATFLLTEYDSTGSATGNTFSVSPSTTVTYGEYTFAPLGTSTASKKTLRRTKISYDGPIIDNEIEEPTEPDYSSMTQEELIAIINQQNQRIEELENSGTEEE